MSDTAELHTFKCCFQIILKGHKFGWKSRDPLPLRGGGGQYRQIYQNTIYFGKRKVKKKCWQLFIWISTFSNIAMLSVLLFTGENKWYGVPISIYVCMYIGHCGKNIYFYNSTTDWLWRDPHIQCRLGTQLKVWQLLYI